MTGDDLARIAYAAYGETTDHKNYRGDPMPAFDDFGDTIRAAWCAAAAAVVAETTAAQVVVVTNVYPQPVAMTAERLAILRRTQRPC